MSNEARARKLATEFRHEHGLGLNPVGDIFDVVYAHTGIDVLSVSASEAEHGLSMMLPSTGRVVIVVATTAHPMRQRSSVAHELGHVQAGDLLADATPVPGARTPEEIRADAFARHLLLPVDAVLARVGTRKRGIGEADLAALVQEFGVSAHLAAIQLRDAGLISGDRCQAWANLSSRTLAARFGWLGRYESLADASQRPRAPQGLVTKAVEGYRRGVLGVQELALWYGQSGDDLRVELGPAHPSPETADETYWDLEAPLFPPSSGTS